MNMSMGKQFAKQYANNYVETIVSEASPHKLIQMLYEGVIKNIRITKVFIQQKNYEKKAEHVNKALSILMTLREGVDLDKGGDVAQNLYALYDYCYRQLVRASISDDVKLVDEVFEYLTDLHDAWAQMPDTYKSLSTEQIQRLSE